MVQPVLRIESWQGLPYRVAYIDNFVVLCLDGIECYFCKYLGSYPQRVEGLLKEDHRGARIGYLGIGSKLIPS